MRILFIAPYMPSGIRSRSLNFIKRLNNTGHSIHFYGLEDPYSSEKYLDDLRGHCEIVKLFRLPRFRSFFNVFIGLFQSTSLQTAFARSSRLKKAVANAARETDFDLIHIEHIRAGYCLPQDRTAPGLYDSVDCITSLYKIFARKKATLIGRVVSRIEAKKTERYESRILSLYDGAIVTSDVDRCSLIQNAMEQEQKIPEIRTIANGVDGSYFIPDNSRTESASIVFSGKMSYAANVLAAKHFVEDIFPMIKEKNPEARFTIVGANPPKAIRNLAKREGIAVTGWVEDIRPFLRKAEVVVCPLRVAVGIQNKLLEALALAKSVVVYPEIIGSLKPSAEPPFIVASSPEEFAESVCGLFADESRRRSLQIKARNYVERFYDWEEKTRELELFYKKIISLRRSETSVSHE